MLPDPDHCKGSEQWRIENRGHARGPRNIHLFRFRGIKIISMIQAYSASIILDFVEREPFALVPCGEVVRKPNGMSAVRPKARATSRRVVFVGFLVETLVVLGCHIVVRLDDDQVMACGKRPGGASKYALVSALSGVADFRGPPGRCRVVTGIRDYPSRLGLTHPFGSPSVFAGGADHAVLIRLSDPG